MDIFSSLRFSPKKESISCIHRSSIKANAIDSETVKAVFQLVKVTSFDDVDQLSRLLQEGKEKIDQCIADESLNSLEMKLLKGLDSKGWIEAQQIVEKTKNAMLANFAEGGDRGREVDVFKDSSTTLCIKVKEDGFYLKEGWSSSRLFTFQEFFHQCKREDLPGLKLDHLKEELKGTNLSGKDLTGTDFTSSDMTGSDFTGAVQDGMVICGTTMNRTTGFELLPTTKLDEKTKFRETEIIFYGWKQSDEHQLSSRALIEFIELIDKIKDTSIDGQPSSVVLMRRLIISLYDVDLIPKQAITVIDCFLEKRRYLDDKEINKFVMQRLWRDGEPDQKEKYIKGNEQRILNLMLSVESDISEAAARLYKQNKNLFSGMKIEETHNEILATLEANDKRLEENATWDKNKHVNDHLEGWIKNECTELFDECKELFVKNRQRQHIEGSEQCILDLMLNEEKAVSDAAARLYGENKDLFLKMEVKRTHREVLKKLEENDGPNKNGKVEDALEILVGKGLLAQKAEEEQADVFSMLPGLPWRLHNNLVNYILANMVMPKDQKVAGDQKITADDITTTLLHLKTKLDPDEKKVLEFYEGNGQLVGLAKGIRSPMPTPVSTPSSTPTSTPTSTPNSTPTSTPVKVKPQSTLFIGKVDHEQ